ncbi:MAG: hypothetical protein JOZ62_10140 [Acidobacteriaceae bacterium]|nr:hypothetical protein [Acidobacteriaceae bacterium]
MAALCAAALSGHTYDIVVSGGRVIDPETKLDAVRNIGITGERIAAVSTGPLAGKQTIDAHGLIVSPGFIDLHSHGQNDENQRYQVHDGVTTALELEIGVADVDGWYREREGKRIINSGASAGHVPNRMFDPQTMADRATFRNPTEPSAGIRHVLVNGGAVIRDGQLDGAARFGQAIRAPQTERRQ